MMLLQWERPNAELAASLSEGVVGGTRARAAAEAALVGAAVGNTRIRMIPYEEI